jgi:putative MATE family efflux protein
MLAAIGTPPDILDIAASYSRITFFTLPILFGYLIYTTFLRGTGDARTPFYTLIASTTLTMALTPALILGRLGFPRLETNGAAVGNVLANGLSFAGLLLYLRRSKHMLALDGAMLAGMRVRWDMAARIVRLGLPSAVNLVMISLSEVAVLFFVNHFGSTATAAYGAVNQVVSYVQFPAVSIGIGASIFGAQAIGAGRLERIPKIVRSAVVLNYVVEGVLVTLGYLFSVDLISLFIRQPQTVAIAHSLLVITLWSYPIYGNARVLAGTMLASGAVLWPTLLSILSIWGVEVPVAFVLMQRMGLDGVWYGYPAAFIAGLAFQTVYYFAIWKRRPLERLI